jgi:hypothetical protein
VTGAIKHAQSAFGADLDGDGDVDVLSASQSDDTIAWYENQGSGQFGPKTVITTKSHYPQLVSAIDFDGDGDADLLTCGGYSGSSFVAWHRNLGGGQFGPMESFSQEPYGIFSSAVAADLDGDGDPEVISGALAKKDIVWYENFMFTDCNGNGLADSLDIGSGSSFDCNGNGIPDECDLASGYSHDIDGDGQLDDCTTPPLSADVYELSLAAGGQQTFKLNGPSSPSSQYLLLGTSSGTSPGVAYGKVTIPLNLDAYLRHSATTPNVAPLSTSFGPLTGGVAVASITLPPASSPGLIGAQLHHAFLVLDGTSGDVTFVSNVVPLTLMP